MQVIHGTGSSQVVLAERSVTPTAAYNAGVTSAAVTSGSVLTTTAATYGQYDSGFNFGLSGNLYTSGSYQYGRIAIKNAAGTTLKTIRVVIPASSSGSVTSITVARPYGDMRDWDLSEENHVYVNVNLSALNGSTVLATDTGRVNVGDIVNFFAINTGAVIASDSSNYGTYDQTFYVQNFLYTSGNYRYARIQLRNSAGNDLDLIRIQIDAAGSSSGSITITNEQTSSTVNPYYGTLPYYAYYNNKHWVYVRAVSTGAAERTQYIDINDIVNYAYQLGGGGQSGGPTNSVRLYCVSRTENSAGLVTCDFSVSSYNGLFWRQGNYYDFYYY
jgi:hypothetical protein